MRHGTTQFSAKGIEIVRSDCIDTCHDSQDQGEERNDQNTGIGRFRKRGLSFGVISGDSSDGTIRIGNRVLDEILEKGIFVGKEPGPNNIGGLELTVKPIEDDKVIVTSCVLSFDEKEDLNECLHDAPSSFVTRRRLDNLIEDITLEMVNGAHRTERIRLDPFDGGNLKSIRFGNR